MRKSQKLVLRWVIGAVVVLNFSACAVPKYLISNDFLGESRTSKFVLEPTGSEDDPMNNVYVYICNVGSKDCQQNLLLQNVVP